MKRDNVNYVLVGAAVLVAFAMLVVTLVVITGTRGGSVGYHAYFDNVTGVRLGAPVLYQGFRIGQVDDIVPERDGGTRYRVELAVRKDWPIPADSVAQLQASGLLADVRVAIRGGESTAVLPPGAEMASEAGGDVFAAMNELADELTVLTRDRIRPLVETLAVRIDSIAGSIDAGLPSLVSESSALLARLNQAADNVNRLLGEDNRLAVSATLGDLRIVAADLRETQTQTQALIAVLNETLNENRPEIRQVVVDLERAVSTIAQRMDSVAHHLDSSSRNFDEFSREIRRNPNRLLFSPKADDVEER
ncbi:MlaD family protein [Xanthomonadaceae bacterium JHOS43]|nr:MlaD family protein [Xanthomonadaceae bacterium JHOS43]